MYAKMLKKFLKILFLTWRLKFPIYDNLKLATISLELSKEKKKRKIRRISTFRHVTCNVQSWIKLPKKRKFYSKFWGIVAKRKASIFKSTADQARRKKFFYPEQWKQKLCVLKRDYLDRCTIAFLTKSQQFKLLAIFHLN